MKKEEFIQYLEGIENVLDVAGLGKLSGVMSDIIEKASTIEINVTYPHYQYYTWPYRPYNPYQPYWYNSTTAGGTVTTSSGTTTNFITSSDSDTMKLDWDALMGNSDVSSKWRVEVTGPGESDWELVKTL